MSQNQQHGSRHRGLVVLCLFATLMILALPAVAARGGRGHGGTGTVGGTGATLTFDPGTAVVGAEYHINGSGFSPNTWVSVGARFPDTNWWASGETDGQGNFSFVLTATGAGQIVHDAYQKTNSGSWR